MGEYMKIIKVTYGRTVQIKQFNPVKLEVEAQLEENESISAVVEELRQQIKAEIMKDYHSMNKTE